MSTVLIILVVIVVLIILMYNNLNASKNRVISSILAVISELIDESIKGTRSELARKDAQNSKKLLEIHKELVDAMKSKSKKRAYEAMQRHREIIEI